MHLLLTKAEEQSRPMVDDERLDAIAQVIRRRDGDCAATLVGLMLAEEVGEASNS